MHVREILIGHHGLRIRRHSSTRMPRVPGKSRQRDRVRPEPWTLRATLTLVGVTLIAAVATIKRSATFGVTG